MEIITTIVSIALTSLSSYLVWYLQHQRKHKDCVQVALRQLLRSELRQRYNVYTERQSVTPEELDDVTDLYETYHGLGGNGTGTHMYEIIKNLPLKED
jgi:hypothetical protein